MTRKKTHDDQPHDETPEDAPEDEAARRDGPSRPSKPQPDPGLNSHPHVHAPDPAAQHAHDAAVAGETEESPEQQKVPDPEQPEPEQPEPEPEPTQSAAVSIPYGESRVLRIQSDGDIRSLIEYTIDNPAIVGANLAGTDYPALRVRGIMPGTTTLRVAADNADGTILKAIAEITVEECRGPASSIDLVEVETP